MKLFTDAELLAFKALIERLLDAWQGDVFLPEMQDGLCYLLYGYPEGKIYREVGSSYRYLSYWTVTHLIQKMYISPTSGWSDERYEFLWLIAELSDKEWLELFEDARTT